MLRVTIEAPNRRTGRAEVVGVLLVTNDGSLDDYTGDSPRGAYDVMLKRPGERDAWARVEDWPRRERDAVALALAALAACVGERDAAALDAQDSAAAGDAPRGTAGGEG